MDELLRKFARKRSPPLLPPVFQHVLYLRLLPSAGRATYKAKLTAASVAGATELRVPGLATRIAFALPFLSGNGLENLAYDFDHGWRFR